MECDFELREECDPIDPLVLAAYHEAGHAVVAVLQRYRNGERIKQLLPIRYVTIRPKNNGSEYGNLVGVMRLKALKYYSEVGIIVALAGSCAEANLDPAAYYRDGSVDDFSKAGEIMEKLGLEASPQNINRYWELCIVERDRSWSAIEDVAEELLRKDTLTQKEVFAIIEKHSIKYNVLQLDER
jgi:hypothetical protein